MTQTVPRVSLKDYYVAFKRFPGFITCLFAGLPFLSFLSKLISFERLQRHLFPPLGRIQVVAYFGCFLFLVLTSLLVFFLFDRSKTRIVFPTACLGFFISIVLYLAIYGAFVRVVEIPTLETSVAVSIGYVRTDFANSNFRNESDVDILRARGTDEDQIEGLWTLRSIVLVRLFLFATYTCALAVVVFAFSWAARAELEAEMEKPGDG